MIAPTQLAPFKSSVAASEPCYNQDKIVKLLSAYGQSIDRVEQGQIALNIGLLACEDQKAKPAGITFQSIQDSLYPTLPGSLSNWMGVARKARLLPNNGIGMTMSEMRNFLFRKKESKMNEQEVFKEFAGVENVYEVAYKLRKEHGDDFMKQLKEII